MVRCFFILFAFFCGSYSVAQDTYVYKNTLKASATLCPGFMLGQTQTNIYVHGHLEYFPEDRVSLRGEGFWFTGAQQKPALLKENSSFLFGGLYHFHKNRLDYFIGLQAGMGFTKPRDTYNSYEVYVAPTTVTVYDTVSYALKALPLISPVTGITFYPGKYVNFFLELRYVNGRYFGYEGRRLNMDEIRISAGLGFQLPLKKK